MRLGLKQTLQFRNPEIARLPDGSNPHPEATSVGPASRRGKTCNRESRELKDWSKGWADNLGRAYALITSVKCQDELWPNQIPAFHDNLTVSRGRKLWPGRQNARKSRATL